MTPDDNPTPLLERIAACTAGAIYAYEFGWLVVWNGSRTFNVFDADGVVYAFTAADHVSDPADAEAMAADWIAALRVEA